MAETAECQLSGKETVNKALEALQILCTLLTTTFSGEFKQLHVEVIDSSVIVHKGVEIPLWKARVLALGSSWYTSHFRHRDRDVEQINRWQSTPFVDVFHQMLAKNDVHRLRDVPQWISWLHDAYRLDTTIGAMMKSAWDHIRDMTAEEARSYVNFLSTIPDDGYTGYLTRDLTCE